MLDELKKIGLSENEAKVYLALLELGTATAQQIADKSGIKRTTIYVQIEALMKLGLVTSFEKEAAKGKTAKTYFRGEDPEYLKNLVKRAKSLVDDQESMLDNLLPGLGKLYVSTGERPRVRFFEGIDGIATMEADLLKTMKPSQEILGISSADEVFNIFPAHNEDYTPKRVKRNIAARLVYTSSKGAILKATDKESMRQSRFIPPDKFPFPGDITIYGDISAFSVIKDAKAFGAVIENKEISASMRALFEMVWAMAENYPENK